MIERICVDDVERLRRVLQIVEVAVDDVAILFTGIEIDADREAAEIEERLYFRADARRETKDAASLPIESSAARRSRNAVRNSVSYLPKSCVSSFAF